MSYRVQTKVQVRFADVDLMGHVNNAHYFTYFEQGRLEYFKNFPELDFRSQQGVPETSVILASISCDFKSPAFLDEILIVKLRTREIKRSSFVMEYEMAEEKTGRLVATGESVLVFFDYVQSKSLAIPDEVRKKFEDIEARSFS